MAKSFNTIVQIMPPNFDYESDFTRIAIALGGEVIKLNHSNSDHINVFECTLQDDCEIIGIIFKRKLEKNKFEHL